MAKRISVVGMGYVGFPIALLLAQYHHVTAVDISEEKVEKINRGISPIREKNIETYFRQKDLDLRATTDAEMAFREADLILVATPTDFDEKEGKLNTSITEEEISHAVAVNPHAVIIIKSTVPIGFTERIKAKHSSQTVLFSPEFLRETKALHDTLYPSRVIIGYSAHDERSLEAAKTYSNILLEVIKAKNCKMLFMKSAEAEAVKLFSNAYLAMRVAFFNELDSFASSRDIDASAIIQGVCLDHRIGKHYNNPSFGYGGYCLPKDTRQLDAEMAQLPHPLFASIDASNTGRKRRIVAEILKALVGMEDPVVGIFGLTAKAGADNFRAAAVCDIIRDLKSKNVRVIIYEPGCAGEEYDGCLVVGDICVFKETADLIVTNRFHKCLQEVRGKVYTRDIYHRD